MRLADADVMTMGDGSIPPLEVRLDLQPGDRVGLYEEVRHPSMGAGYSPIEAIVLGSPEPGWFIGETEDGQEIAFHAGNVADVMMGSPRIGGIFDWFKRLAPPSPGAMIPSQQAPAQLPAVIPPRPEERKGLIAQLKSLFTSPFQAPAQVPTQKIAPVEKRGSIFDIFKKPEVPPGLPAQRPESEVTQYEKKPSMFSFFDPGTKVVIPFAEKAASMVLPEGPGPLAPYIEKALEPFAIIPKSPEPEPFEVRKARQMEFWSGMFPAQEERPPLSEMFKMFTKEEVQPYQEVIPPGIPQRMHRHLKVLPMPRRNTLFPTVEDIARGFMGLYDPIDELWESIRELRGQENWQRYIAKHGFAKEAYETFGSCGGPPSMLQELSSFLHIPWEEFAKRGGNEDDEESDEQVWIDIIFPATELMSQALDLIKPEDIPGRFVLERDEEHGCMLLLTYVEGKETEEAQEGFREERIQDFNREASKGMQAPEEEERSVEEIAESLQEGIQEEEQAILKLTEELEKLSPENTEFREIYEELIANLEESKATLRSLTEELSNLPMPEEESKRAPAKKKKAAKRGGKKKRK